VPRRGWRDYLPIVGWFFLARESGKWGRGFWVRPVLMDLAVAGGLTLLYYWEVTEQLLPIKPWTPPAAPTLDIITHTRFLSHGLVILLLIVATFIDFDEKTIPDEITVPGTLLGLLFATIWPFSLPTSLNLPPPALFPQVLPHLDYLWLTAPTPWQFELDERLGLLIGLGCYLGLCFGILNKRWTLRRGWKKAAQFFFASIVRRRSNWPVVLGLAVVGVPLISVAWFVGGSRWQGLLSSLVGAAAGGALLWAIRIVGKHTLRQEAMGFGDVTLMAMIGAFVGWQGAFVAFFIAPFAALFIAVAQWVITRRKDVAFGPYLATGGLYVLLKWSDLWEVQGLRWHFSIPWLIPATVVICLALMWLMLWSLRVVREWLTRGDDA
jgi:prepilin signal peptidase PulO-like enzyme (type II secretory pathway)